MDKVKVHCLANNKIVFGVCVMYCLEALSKVPICMAFE